MTAHDQFHENLPLYAVGALPSDEAHALETHLAGCAQCREELQEFRQAAAQIALAIPPVPPAAHLQQRLMAQVAAEAQRPSAIPSIRQPQRETASRLSPRFLIPAFAVIVLAILLISLWGHNRELSSQNLDLAEKLQVSEETLRQNLALIDTLRSADAQRVTLVEAGQNPKPEARTIYSPERRSLVLLASHLRPLPADKVYELWVLPANGGAPVPAGTFSPDANGSASLILTQLHQPIAAKGFAVTAEKKPGSPTPTLPILLSGTS